MEEIIAVMRTAGDRPHGRRLRGLIVIMWRAGLRIQEALALAEGDQVVLLERAQTKQTEPGQRSERSPD